MVRRVHRVGRHEQRGAAVTRATAAGLAGIKCPTREVATAAGDVLLRGLSRFETLDIPDLVGIEREATIISRSLVDPVMTVDQVKAWMKAAPAGEFDKISTAVGELSGLLESSGKDAYKSNGRRSRAGV